MSLTYNWVCNEEEYRWDFDRDDKKTKIMYIGQSNCVGDNTVNTHGQKTYTNLCTSLPISETQDYRRKDVIMQDRRNKLICSIQRQTWNDKRIAARKMKRVTFRDICLTHVSWNLAAFFAAPKRFLFLIIRANISREYTNESNLEKVFNVI